jgi:hypothetical protein
MKKGAVAPFLVLTFNRPVIIIRYQIGQAGFLVLIS